MQKNTHIQYRMTMHILEICIFADGWLCIFRKYAYWGMIWICIFWKVNIAELLWLWLCISKIVIRIVTRYAHQKEHFVNYFLTCYYRVMISNRSGDAIYANLTIYCYSEQWYITYIVINHPFYLYLNKMCSRTLLLYAIIILDGVINKLDMSWYVVRTYYLCCICWWL
jgi:hypothetical protein